MDAYDIFKKLSIGLKFKPGPNKSKITNTQPVKPEAQEIKNEEPLKPEPYSDDDKGEFSSEDESHSESEKNDSESDKSGDDIQILEGVSIEKKRKKKVKEKSEDLKKKLELEEENCYRNSHNIKAVGRHIAPALRQFSNLHSRYQVSETTLATVQKCGYVEPTPVQRQALPAMLEDRQILTIAPTGSGKTAAFLIPILHTLNNHQGGPRALILCPTRELAVQIYREALRLSEGTDLRCTVVKKMQQSKIKERESTIKKSDIVISTPNRLCYLLNQENVNIQLNKVHWLIIDEADKLFEGSSEQESDFRQQMEQILTACDNKGRRIAMFSATHSAPIAKWARKNMRGLINISVGHRNTATNTVEQELLYCGNESGKLIAFRQLIQKGLKPPVLIFVQSKDRAKQLFKELIYDGINVDVIHADRTQAQRDNVVRSFRIGKIWVLICTELMGRGIDFHGVSLVINYDFPPSAVAYIHRVGRAGRAGQKGKAITFFTQDDFANLRSIASVMRQSGCNVPDYMLKLKKNVNLQKRLLKRAPSRDKISTVLEKNAMKRRMEIKNQEIKEQSNKKFKGTDKIENAKRSKQRKVENESSFVKKTNNKKDKKSDKKDMNKKHKKPFVKKKAKNVS